MTKPDPISHGLYIHIPFCVRLCPYCDFNTFLVSKSAVQAFLSSLKTELFLIADRWQPAPVQTVFIGGGTPTVLSGKQLTCLIEWVHDSVGIAPGAEITVEANPGSFTKNGVRAMVAAGVNRLSLGVQSFCDATLQRIGRNHTARDVYDCYELATDAGVDNINFDLMFALPEQTLADWEATLQQALALAPQHFSCYSLIIEDGTPFAAAHEKGLLPLPSTDDEATMYEMTLSAMATAGYGHYEVSNFARPGLECRHNLLYWHNKAWLGAGPGAHAAWHGRRHWNERSLERYSDYLHRGQLPIAGEERPNAQQQMDETMMLGLRLVDGISLADFARRYKTTVTDEYGPTVSRLVEWELLEIAGDALRLTPRGLMVANAVSSEFLRTSVPARNEPGGVPT